MNLVFDGGSFVVDASGEIIFQASQFQEEVFSFDLEVQVKDIVSDSKLTLNIKKDKLFQTYSLIQLLMSLSQCMRLLN